MLVRRLFEAMVFTYLVEELRCGDNAVVGCEEYGDWTRMLLDWDTCIPKVEEFCAQAGLPATAHGFTAHLRQQLTDIAAEVDEWYPNNADLTVDPLTGVPSLKARQGADRTASAEAVDAELSRRLPARSVLEHVARAAHWTEWWHRPRPQSGSDPKVKNQLSRYRYTVTAFTYGCGLGAAQAARHMRGQVSAHELGAIAQRHFTPKNLTRAGADVIDTYMRLDLVTAWGDGSVAAVDGTMMDTLDGNPSRAEMLAMAGDVRGAVEHMQRVLDGLLLLARSQAGLAAREPVDLAAIAAAAKARAAANVAVQPQLRPAPVSGEPVLLERMIGNLVDNAVRYNRAGGWSSIRVRRVGSPSCGSPTPAGRSRPTRRRHC
jgi:signal transduction histidine kinase